LNLLAVVAKRVDRVEPMIAAEAGRAIAPDGGEEQSILRFPRPGGEIMPAGPAAAVDQRHGF